MHPGSGLARSDFWLRYERYPYLLAKIVTFLLAGYAVYAGLQAVQDVLTPILVSLALAYLLDPAVDKFEELKFSRTSGILACLGIGGASTALFVLFLWPTVAHLIAQIGDGLPKVLDLIQNQAIPWVDETALPWLAWNTGLPVPSGLDQLTDEAVSAIETQLPSLMKTGTSTLGQLWGRTGAIVGSLLNLVLIPVLTFYFLRDFDHMRLAAVDYLPLHNRAWLIDRIAKMDVVIGAWFRGQIEVAAILGVLYAIGLGITFGVAGIGALDGVAIGLLAGLLNVVPYLGFVIGLVLAVLLALLDWVGWAPLIGVVLTFAIVQGLEGYVVTPRVVGEKVGLSPVVVILALLLGGQLLGPLGVVLALPLAGAIRVLLPDLAEWYRASDLYTGQVHAEPVTAGAEVRGEPPPAPVPEPAAVSQPVP
ncbi:MAG: AI-2E family transporter, partial [Myxococcota bacterium]